MKKENLIGYVIGLVIVISIFIGLCMLYDYLFPWKPSKTDGWIYFSDGERYVGHDNAIGLCRMDNGCNEIYMGCGAVNCQCVNKTEFEIDEFFKETQCSFVMGEGIVCV